MKVKCNCKHEFQDATHGVGTRIANPTKHRDEKHTEVRCTVCKTLHRVELSQLKR